MAEGGITLAEGTALRVKQLEIKFDDFETASKMTDCCLSELDADQEEDRDKIDKLEKRVTQLEADLESESELFEERVGTLKTQNTELRIHLNLVIDMVNNITSVLNKTFNNNEPADEMRDNTQAGNEPTDEAMVVVDDEPAAEDNEPMQLTLRQVYDMYQSQPPDEEGWEEMSKAIKTAEEYEVSLQKQQGLSTRVNGLTQDEWNDLLRI